MASPTDVPGLLHRWRADSITLADGAAVPSWPALVGGAALQQATATAQPAYRTDVLNGQPVVRFDGTGDFLEGALPADIPQPVTVVFVVKLNVNAQQQLFLSTTSQVWSNGSVWAMNLGGTSLTGGTPGTNWHAIVAVLDGANSRVADNGAQAIGGNAGADGLTTARWRVGAFNNSRFLNGDVAEILIYDRALTAAEQATVDSYAQDRYGITVADYVPSTGADVTQVASDVAGATDAVAVAWTQSRTIADGAVARDAPSRAATASRSPSDVAGVQDVATAASGREWASQDAAGTSDAVEARHAASTSVTEVAGVADATSLQYDRAPSAMDAAGVADAITATYGRGLAATDAAEVVDAVATTRGRGATFVDAAAVADALAIQLDRGPAVEDTVGAIDGLTTRWGRSVSVADEAPVADVIGALRGDQLAVEGILPVFDDTSVRYDRTYLINETVSTIDEIVSSGSESPGDDQIIVPIFGAFDNDGIAMGAFDTDGIGTAEFVQDGNGAAVFESSPVWAGTFEHDGVGSGSFDGDGVGAAEFVSDGVGVGTFA